MNPVYIRLGLYVLSTVIAALPAAYAGLITYDMAADVFMVKPVTLLTSLLGGGVITGGIFGKFGKK
ncbi:hypothetical protein [Cypionkella sinensis]|uniref:Photosystem II reaction center X protein n=1 Tax=Cypionkella sinensis TaxID=1756043 RepID=A0ABV7IVW5_9RHOB